MTPLLREALETLKIDHEYASDFYTAHATHHDDLCETCQLISRLESALSQAPASLEVVREKLNAMNADGFHDRKMRNEALALIDQIPVLTVELVREIWDSGRINEQVNGPFQNVDARKHEFHALCQRLGLEEKP